MAEVVNENITVIRQNDPDLPDYLDFEKLRREGLEHIGNLSGKIWTDHNVHDPGITILEVLVYALMDLGYKTNLPFQDLIATLNTNGNIDDNFLTPLEILTVNPVTILDFRKLVLEVEGVRNAWLEPVKQEQGIYLDIERRGTTLYCENPNNTFQEIELNGLYKVYIEKDNEIDNDNLLQDVEELLVQHRNLCEDFVEVEALESLALGVCVEAEIHAEFTAEKVYVEIFHAIKKYIQPEITYYTLEELLDKGKTIDDIFAGRPYREKSFGFIDTEELESFNRREFINLSDLYDIILSIEGVRKIKNISIKDEGSQNMPQTWQYQIEEGKVPVFSKDKTCIDLYNTKGALRIDKLRIERTFSMAKQFEMPLENLNTKIPAGINRENLEEFYSIQNDFPVVYGIGEDGLPDRASLLRETQALQLKGYLMFYDQILANYTSQLANIKSLFSLTPEEYRTEEEKHTYFTQIPDSIPGIEDLLRFYTNDTDNLNSLLAVPIKNDSQWHSIVEQLKKNPNIELTIGNICNDTNALVDLFNFSSTGVRSIYINQLIDAFFNGKYTIQVLQDRRGYFFVLQTDLPDDVVMVGAKRYDTADEARREAKNLTFLGTMNQSYKLTTNASDTVDADQHFFDITYTPISYIDLIQELTEDKSEYAIRRKQFLDHLLARFGEEFTDYTILQYQNGIDTEEHVQEEINDQSKYVNRFAEISRNRAKAYDYSVSSWNTENVSGFEKRVSLLSGIENYERRNLCNFEVVQNFRLELQDWAGNVLFRSNRGYENKEELYDSAKKVLSQIRHKESYKQLEKSLNGFDAKTMHRIFSEQVEEENIIITKHDYHQQLINTEKEVVVLSKSTKMKSEKAALDKKEDFIKTINTQNILSRTDQKSEYRLLPLENENSYLDVNALPCEIETLITWKWHVNTINSKEKTASDQVFNAYEDAWDHMIQEAELEDFLTKHDVAIRWKLPIRDGITLDSIGCYPDAYRAVAAWRQAKVLGSSKANYEIKNEGTSIRIQLKNEKGNPIAISDVVEIDQETIETILAECTTIFGNRNTKPDYDQEKNKFGFQILGKDNVPALISYCAYDSEKEALEQLDTVFKLGEVKKNYLLSGDQGNPEYNYILLDKYNSFLALPPDHFETTPDRTKALNGLLRHFKNNTLPVFVKEEPRRYIWSLVKDDKKLLESTNEFTSKARAQSDFDKVIVSEAIQPDNELYTSHCYNFEVIATPALYKYRYGISSVNNELEPLFLSTDAFKTYTEASEGYTRFIKELPKLSFKVSPKNDTEFGLFLPKSETPIVGGYSKDRSSLEKAQKVTGYLSAIYSRDLTPKESFVSRRMVENQKGRFEWRFYKKNTPLAINPYQYSSESTAELVKRSICDIIPPIDLKQCTKKEVVVCPEGDPNRYHYQVEFTDDNKNNFVLISYNGYSSAVEAEEAWQAQWLDVITIATDPNQYVVSGKINLEETYQNSQAISCANESFLVVIPKVIRAEVEASGKDIVTYYSELADLYPIYKKVSDDEDDIVSYKFKVVVPQKDLIPTSNIVSEVVPHIGSLLWISELDYADEKSVVEAYSHFYNLAGTSNNCRLFCEKGNFYTGLVEVLAESSREFETEAEAWDDAYPNQKDECQDCVPGGVREFIYAAEDDQNYEIICDKEYWKFKVVSPEYFVVDHNCYYNSKEARDQQMNHWTSKLKSLNWDEYITGKPSDGGGTRPGGEFLYDIGYGYSDKEFCEFMFNLRDSLIVCPNKFAENQQEEEIENELITSFLEEKYKNDSRILTIVNRQNFTCALVKDLTDYFPIYKTDQGYCFRVYDIKNDVQTTPDGLQPCGCEDVVATADTLCNEPYPFVSKNYYSCCTEAANAFTAFCLLITNQNTSYAFQEISKTEYGPYSFQVIDKRKELAYHPQQYDNLQEVKDAIERTKIQVGDVGLHLLEHILLRPITSGDCFHEYNTGEGEGGLQRVINCLLPICPDYNCDIEWQPDLDKDDPCANDDQATLINYIPGSDPYSFWATVVIPAWSKRFRTLEQRETFESFLYKEVPALVGLNILWLGPRDLCDFEDAYRKWLVWKEDPEAYKCNPNDPRPDCLLSNYIKRLKSEQPCASTSFNQGDCNCNPDDTDKTFPEDSMGSIFWGECVQIIDGDIIDFPIGEVPATIETRPTSKTTVQTESKTVKEVKKEPKELPKKKPTAKSSAKAAVKKAEPVAKAKKVISKKKITKTQAVKEKLSTKESPSKKVKKKVTTAQTKKEELAVVRKRKPGYLKAVETTADENIKKTKSYERTVFFLNNTPTIKGYVTLVNFFNRYSLQKDNAIPEYLMLLKNATYHLFDKLVLDATSEIKKEDIDQLAEKMKRLSEKGMSLKEVHKEWNAAALGSLANAKSLTTIKKLLK